MNIQKFKIILNSMLVDKNAPGIIDGEYLVDSFS